MDVTEGGDIAIGGAVPSGLVTLRFGRVLADGESVRVISLVSPREGRYLRSVFAREVRVLDQPLTMPAGGVIAIHLDRAGRAIGVSPPVAVVAGATTEISPVSVVDGALLVAWLSRSDAHPEDLSESLHIHAVDIVGSHAPDVEVAGDDAILAVWYDLEGKHARVVIDSKRVRLAKDVADIARGFVTQMTEPLVALPSITVAVGPLPRSVKDIQMTLSVGVMGAEGLPLIERAVQAGREYRFESLPAAVVVLDLNVDGFSVTRNVDLTSGTNVFVQIPLQPIVVSGTVYYGDRPTRASLRFEQKDAPFAIETDERGSFTATLWQAGNYFMDVVLSNFPGAPFRDLVSIGSPGLLDIHVPANSVRVRVSDANSGAPIEHGQITIQSRWADGSGSRSGVTTVAMKGLETVLPPLREGTSEIRVQAPGYSEAEFVVLAVPESNLERVVEFRLSKSLAEPNLTILLGGSIPAGGAEVASWSGDQLIWKGTADDDGRIQIPESIARSRAIVRHPAAATTVVVFGVLTENDRLSLAPAAPPLIVHVVQRDESVIGSVAARMTIWFGGVRLSGPEAAFATWSLAATAPDGSFVARGLPARPLRMLATRKFSLEQIRSGSLDGLASAVPYPWPALAKVTLAGE